MNATEPTPQESPKTEDETTEQIRTMFSRSEVIECPMYMALGFYIGTTYKLPRYAHFPRGLRYHYTDASGLYGIVTRQRLWATEVSFLNDPSEGKFLAPHILRLMENKAGGLSDLETQIIEEIRLQLEKNPHSDSYNISFCSNGDLLSQWRGYGSFGSGYAIGFDLNEGPNPQAATAIDVIYGLEGLETVALDILSILVEAAPKWPDVVKDFGRDAARVISSLSLAFKDESYREESETRIILRPRDGPGDLFPDEAPLRFRPRGSDIVPYVDFALGDVSHQLTSSKLPIKRIVVGPGVTFDRNRASVAELLRTNGYSDVEIVPSEIPFRA